MEVIKAFTKLSIVTELRKLLINNSGITAYVNNNIFPLVAPENTNGDCIVYFRDKYSKDYSNMGIYNEKCTVTFVAVSENYDRCLLIAELVNDEIEGIHKNTSNYNYQCRLIDSMEDLIDKKYIQTLMFEIK